MLPCEITEASQKSSCAFIPVSPAFEWHSYHLPLGTDALISEGVAEMAAEITGGIYFRALSFGLDQYRNKEQLNMWGFDERDKVFGMRFPELPVSSEYSQVQEMKLAVKNRLDAVRMSGFKYAFILCHHGGGGQCETLAKIAEEETRDGFNVFFIKTGALVKAFHEHMKVGGHAGMSETLMLMAFRPELIDLSKLPEGILSVRKFGILHNKPEIESQYNPRNVLALAACELRKRLADAVSAFVKEKISSVGKNRT